MPQPEEFLVDVGDVNLAALHWPGTGDPLLLLHATGFHARCWTQVVNHLPGRDIYAVDLRYHGGSGAAGTVDWGTMANDIVKLVDALALTSVIGVGHSIGGHLLARAAATHPDLCRHLVLIDPVISSPERYAQYHENAVRMKAEDHPVARRKNAWKDSQEMFARFKEREPFNSWQPEVLRDYCDYALKPAGPDGFRQLACDPINEASVYMNQRGNEVIVELLSHIITPVTLLRAPPGDIEGMDFSNSPTWPELGNRLPNCTEVLLQDLNHFIPMQRPDLVAQYISAVQ